MKTFKHLFTALLLLFATVATAHDFVVDGIYYNITDATNKTVNVTYKGTSYSQYSNEYTGDVVIPESVTNNGKTYSVTSIGGSAFSGCTGLTSIEIPNSVTSIGGYAFADCSGLTSIVIPNSVTTIGYSAFSYCTSLTCVVIPNGVTSIGEDAFYRCTGLTSVEIPNSVTSIGGSAFYGCSGLKSIEIPNSVTSIGDYAFYNCSGLTSIVIPNSVTTIGYSAFYGCSGLKTVVNFSNLTFTKGSIGDGYVAYYADKVINTPNGFIDGDFVWGENESGMTLVGYLGNATELTLPANCEGETYVIGESAFYKCTGLTSIVIPSSITSIGGSAFYGCTGLTSVVIPNSVTSIGNYAFRECTGLTSIVIPSSITSIGGSAFYGCTGLTSVVIPNSVTSIGYEAFYVCSSLKTVINFSNLTFSKGSWSNGCVAYYADKVINAPNGFIDGDFVWGENESGMTLVGYLGNATELTLPANCEGETYVIGESAFYKCTGLTSVVIPNSVTSIGSSAFSGCSGLTSIVIPNSVTSIGNDAFADCSGLTSVEIPNSVTTIGNGAFSGCCGLTSIEIGNGVTSIGNDAFYGCSSLKKAIWLTNTPPSGYKNVGATYNYVANNQYSGLNNTKIYPYLSSMFEVDGVRYVPVSPAERTCDAIDCAYNDTTSVDIVIGKTVSYKGISMNVKEIMPYALYANKKIKSVKFENEGNIGDYALSGCTALTTANTSNEGNVGSYAFNGCTALTTANISNKGNVGSYAFSGCTALTTANVLNKGYIGDYAFSGCTALTTANISNEGNIGDYAFSGCNYLAEATLGDSVTSIGTEAFSNCKALGNIVIPDAVTYIGNKAFSGCSALKSTEIGAGVTTINEATFSGCSAMTSITVGNNVKTIGKNALDGCSSLAEITIPQSVTQINDYAFYNCSSLKDVIIEDAETALSLGSNGSSPLFNNCPLDSVYIGCKIIYSTLSDYGYSPFYRNTSLKTVVITDTETEIYDNEFYGCSNLKKVSIGNGINKIGNWAFSGCSSLDYFAFGKNVRSIGEEAFSDCNNVSQIISRAKIAPACGAQALDDINKWSCTLWVPENYKSEYQAAEQWKEFFFIEGIAAEMYTVTFVVDGEIYDTVSVEYDEVIALPETPTKEGHTFSGWSEMPETMPAEDITIEGTFTVNHYTVTYVVDGEVYATDSIAYGSEIILIDEPTKEGRTFSGWSEAPATMPAEDVTIEGTFTVNHYTVTYVVDGEVYATDSIAYGSEIILIDEPTKEGHTFSGWSEAPATMPDNDITVEGCFNLNYYTITYIVDGEVYATDSIAYGSEIILIDEPTKEGHTFSGWSEVPETMPDNDITVEGYFIIDTAINDVKDKTINVQNVYYDLNGRAIVNPTNGVYILNGKKVLVK